MAKLTRIQDQIYAWYGKMLECVKALPPEERAEFEYWDQHRKPGVVTSNWPGFAKYLPKMPGQ
jgi:hypothetical protein